MLILCPYCRKQNEIEHVERGNNVECTCGAMFDLNDSTVLADYSAIDAPPPKQIGPYPIERFIGRGGMGRVYLGTHPNLNIPVAIKTLFPEYAAKPELRDRFMQTAKICAKLAHPNIVRVYDFGFEADGSPYLVLEYIAGGTLQEHLNKSGVISPRRAVEVGISVACALAEAHKCGIVHRDVKPDNIMMASDGVCKLSDLGLAKIDLLEYSIREQQNYSKETKTGGLGTLQYMAPEQALSAKDCDIRADIYSLGVSLFQLLTDKLPYETYDPDKLYSLWFNVPPRSPHALRPEIPPELEQIILHCIEVEPENRYQTPQELREDLEACREAVRHQKPQIRNEKITLRDAPGKDTEKPFFTPSFLLILFLLIV
ncbi:MAG: serine/threonine protein kinase, partial [Lentisphaeria bacterium]|nr:serine/threonine protein kinase [Lentisphaeria bacterium]